MQMFDPSRRARVTSHGVWHRFRQWARRAVAKRLPPFSRLAGQAFGASIEAVLPMPVLRWLERFPDGVSAAFQRLTSETLAIAAHADAD
jgi:hypothetical protein